MYRLLSLAVVALGGFCATVTEVPSCSRYVAWKVACSDLVILSARSLMVERLPARLLAAEMKPHPRVPVTATAAAASKAIVRGDCMRPMWGRPARLATICPSPDRYPGTSWRSPSAGPAPGTSAAPGACSTCTPPNG